jgi:GTP-binding protein EngB required for normal cell division/HSP20 family molecular chaperone IbpA
MEGPETLNSNHKRHLLISAQYVDGLLTDIESILASSLSRSPFPKYQLDITPAQAKLVQDYLARIRAQMVQVLKGLDIVAPPPRFGARHSIRVTLEFAEIAFDECRPEAMRGYGEIPPSLTSELNGLVDEMKSVLRKLNTYLAQGGDHDLKSRLDRLDRTSGGVELLEALERIISERGLVEFRPALSVILDKIESPSFQVAVFGRVSSGKSSLLNHILKTDILPVGVTPITAVPTRLVYGREPRLRVSFVDRKTEQTSIERLGEFVSELYNPGNSKHATRIVVELPSSRLQDGVVLVDTPGLGSLATAGAAETLAYLPQCDLGVVLVDAGSTLTMEDLATIQSLYEASIPASVLLSKADLLRPADRARSVQYASDHIKSQLGIELAVWPVSTKEENVRLLDEWFVHEIQPLFLRHQELARQSIHRKIAALRDGVETSLKVRLEMSGKGVRKSVKQLREAQAQLRRASGQFEEVQAFCFRASDETEALSEIALDRAAKEIARAWCDKSKEHRAERAVVMRNLAGTASEAANQIFDRLRELAGYLAQALEGAGRALGADAIPADEELVSLVKEMPQLDPGQIEIQIRSDFLTVLGQRITEARVRGQLRNQVGQRAGQVYRSYGRMIEAWSTRTLSELHRHFDAHADGYRAQLEQLTEGRSAGAEEGEALRNDLTLLARFQVREQTPVESRTA